MKSLQEIIKQEPVFLNDWKQDGMYQLIADFDEIYLSKKEFEASESPYSNVEYWREKKSKMERALVDWQDVHILFASYGAQGYEGDSFVLLEKDGKLFEVNAGHCSCYGLEGQFKPSEVTLIELEHRLVKGKMGEDNYSGNEYAKELKEFLGIE